MNTCLSDLDDLSKYEVIRLAFNHKLKYKSKLGLSKKIKFGVEIEALGTDFIRKIRDNKNIYYFEGYPSSKPKDIYGKDRWILYSDDSLYDEDSFDVRPPRCEIEDLWYEKKITTEEYKDMLHNYYNGGEVASPILKDNFEDWNKIKKMLKYMKKTIPDLRINESCSTHNHFDIEIFDNNPELLYNFIILLAENENVLTRFYSGEYINIRSITDEWANPIKPLIRYGLDFNIDKSSYRALIKSIYFGNPTMKEYSFDFWEIYNGYYKHLSNTFENRLPNGTLSKEIIQNNVMLMGFLMEYASSGMYDVERGIYNLKSDNNCDILGPFYVADMLPNDDLKLDFLSQYYKDGRVTKSKQLVKSKRIFY